MTEAQISPWQAYQAYKVVRNLPDKQDSLRQFKKFLGITDERSSLLVAYQSRDAMKKVRWLLGPHASAMYKIWEAQHEKGPTSRQGKSQG